MSEDGATMNDLRKAVEKSGAETPKELIEWANGLYLEGYMHDSFVYGAGSAADIVEERLKHFSNKFVQKMSDADNKQDEIRYSTMAVAVQRVYEDLFEDPDPIEITDLDDETGDME